MKKLILIFFSVLLLHVVCAAQILNADFEDWTNGNPNNWQTTNSEIYTPILQTTDNYSPSYAVHGQVLPLGTLTLAPSIVSGTDARGFQLNQRPAALEGYYKTSLAGSDNFVVTVILNKNSSSVGGASVTLPPVDSYTKFSVDLFYSTEEVPDTSYISFVILNFLGFPTVGSEFYLDHLSWSSTSDVNGEAGNFPKDFSLEQNYPNPFNPGTKISYSIPEIDNVKIVVYDIIGNEITTLVNKEQPAGNYEVEFNADNVPSGVYFYTLQSGSFTRTMKMLLLK